MLDREYDRIALQEDVNRFLAAGGKIEYLPPGACSERNELLNEFAVSEWNANTRSDVFLSRRTPPAKGAL